MIRPRKGADTFLEQAHDMAGSIIGERYGVWQRGAFEGAASVMGITETATATHGQITQLTAGARRYAKLGTGAASAYWRPTTFATPMVSDTTAKKFYCRARMALGGGALSGAFSFRGLRLDDASGNVVLSLGQLAAATTGSSSGTGSATNVTMSTYTGGAFDTLVQLQSTPSSVVDWELWGDGTTYYGRVNNGASASIPIPAAQALSPTCNLYGSQAADTSHMDVYRILFAFEE